MAAVSSESAKDNFRKYLEKSNTVEALTSALVQVYEAPNRPEKPLEFIVKKLGGRTEAEFVELEQTCDKLQAEVASLKARLENRG